MKNQNPKPKQTPTPKNTNTNIKDTSILNKWIKIYLQDGKELDAKQIN